MGICCLVIFNSLVVACGGEGEKVGLTRPFIRDHCSFGLLEKEYTVTVIYLNFSPSLDEISLSPFNVIWGKRAVYSWFRNRKWILSKKEKEIENGNKNFETSPSFFFYFF